MKSTKKVFSKPRFMTEMSANPLNFDQAKRAIMIGRDTGARCGYIGRSCESSKVKNIFDSSIWLNTTFPSVVGVFGMRGTGKSFNLGIFAECIANMPQVSVGGNAKAPAIVILDVQDQFWTLSLSPSPKSDKAQTELLKKWHLDASQVPNVHCWNPADINSDIPGAREYQIGPQQLTDSDWLALLEQERYSAIGQALLELISNADDCTPATMAASIRSGNLLPSFQSSTVDALRWRLESIAKTNLVNNPGVNIDELLVPGRISIILMRDLPDSLRALTASILVRLLAAKMSKFHQQLKIAKRSDRPAPDANYPPQLWVMMDEAHTIAPRDEKTAANAPLVDYVKRGRDSGLSLIFATQQPSAVDDKLMSQVDMTFTHSLGFEADINAAVARMPTRKISGYKCDGIALQGASDLIRSLKPGEAIIADSTSQRPFVASMRPRLSVHGGDTPTG